MASGNINRLFLPFSLLALLIAASPISAGPIAIDFGGTGTNVYTGYPGSSYNDLGLNAAHFDLASSFTVLGGNLQVSSNEGILTCAAATGTPVPTSCMTSGNYGLGIEGRTGNPARINGTEVLTLSALAGSYSITGFRLTAFSANETFIYTIDGLPFTVTGGADAEQNFSFSPTPFTTVTWKSADANSTVALAQITLDNTPVPEPGTMGMFGIAVLGCFTIRRMRA
jgi:hypothetical protein